METAPNLETVAANGTAVDQGLAVLVTLLRFRTIGADREQLRHRFGNAIGVPEMLLPPWQKHDGKSVN
jgi:hypothetical protein